MAFPIRIKLVNKKSGESFREWAKNNNKSHFGDRFNSPFQLMPYINEQGNIGFIDFEGFYLSNEFLSAKDWNLFVATKKDEKGCWLYEQIGY